MRYLVLFALYTVPHYRTVYYLRGSNKSGEAVCVHISNPQSIPQEHRHCVHCCSFLVVFGRPFFPRYFPYLPQ